MDCHSDAVALRCRMWDLVGTPDLVDRTRDPDRERGRSPVNRSENRTDGTAPARARRPRPG